MPRHLIIICLALLGFGPAVAAESDSERSRAEPRKELFSGEVVLLADALKRREVEFYEEELKEQVVLETPGGELIPILPDWRGRAFYQDERLRDRKVELVGIRRPGVPHLQVLMVFTFDENGRRMYTDYWCDICSIPMYEVKDCECCQGPIRLRFQPQELPEYLDPGRREKAQEAQEH